MNSVGAVPSVAVRTACACVRECGEILQKRYRASIVSTVVDVAATPLTRLTSVSTTTSRLQPAGAVR